MQNIQTQCQLKFDADKVRFSNNPVKFNFTGIMATFGQRLKEERITAGYNQTELAERSRVSKNYISLLEADKIVQPRLYQIDKIAKALNLKPETMRGWLTGTKEPQNFAEFIKGLEDLGIAIHFDGDPDKYDGDLDELKDRIALDTDLIIRRKKK